MIRAITGSTSPAPSPTARAMETFQQELVARWGDMDFNQHLRNTAYLDAAGDVRLAYFATKGFAASELARIGIGPVVSKDEVRYFRELRLHERFRVDLVCLGLSEDGARFRLKNEFTKLDGEKVAVVISDGVWFDLRARKVVVPPDALLTAQAAMPRASELEVLRSR